MYKYTIRVLTVTVARCKHEDLFVVSGLFRVQAISEGHLTILTENIALARYTSRNIQSTKKNVMRVIVY